MARPRLFERDWLPPGERHEHLGILKTGKESEVHLVARHGDGRVVLLAEKRFTSHERRMFKQTSLYAGVGWEGTRHEHRAMRKHTRFGQDFAHSRWIGNEWNNLVHLYDAGATVPLPVELRDDGYLMSFIGDDGEAAPRLASITLEPTTARRAWADILDELAILVAADRVHGDLSAYNVLWWRERPVLIDFSQTVDVITHPAAHDLLVRDVRRIGEFFVRHGVRFDLAWVLSRIGADDRRFAAQIMRRPPAVS